MAKSNSRVLILVEIAVIAAFAMALEYVPHKTGISSIEMSYGVIPITVLALRRGTGAGMAAGLTWGVLDIMLIGFGEGSVLNQFRVFWSTDCLCRRRVGRASLRPLSSRAEGR
ncbi:energy-coupled thiamine transporter ThiT [Lacticaseibacillus camelliae]|uniref:energy-coupled thiamine transporter ThiT n=1 Tax=Lacticaseibacillus camelliae TaxID=381742 RepID=UPI0021E72C5F|nr:energy-coupled thiamine transporter ThiT [Lacticaseibacillus camelliae]